VERVVSLTGLNSSQEVIFSLSRSRGPYRVQVLFEARRQSSVSSFFRELIRILSPPPEKIASSSIAFPLDFPMNWKD